MKTIVVVSVLLVCSVVAFGIYAWWDKETKQHLLAVSELELRIAEVRVKVGSEALMDKIADLQTKLDKVKVKTEGLALDVVELRRDTPKRTYVPLGSLIPEGDPLGRRGP